MTQYNDYYLGKANRYGGHTPLNVILSDGDVIELFRNYVPNFTAESITFMYKMYKVGPILQDSPIIKRLLGLTQEQLEDLRHEFWSLEPTQVTAAGE